MVDTNVFIKVEKSGSKMDFSAWESERVFVSAITVSELLMGVHRANTEERRNRRRTFVETVISAVGVLEFNVVVARVHSEIHSDLSNRGQLMGPHDLIIAATARFHDLPLLTDNVDEFSRVSGLKVIPFTA